jgi:hypothetical protein
MSKLCFEDRVTVKKTSSTTKGSVCVYIYIYIYMLLQEYVLVISKQIYRVEDLYRNRYSIFPSTIPKSIFVALAESEKIQRISSLPPHLPFPASLHLISSSGGGPGNASPSAPAARAAPPSPSSVTGLHPRRRFLSTSDPRPPGASGGEEGPRTGSCGAVARRFPAAVPPSLPSLRAYAAVGSRRRRCPPPMCLSLLPVRAA